MRTRRNGVDLSTLGITGYIVIGALFYTTFSHAQSTSTTTSTSTSTTTVACASNEAYLTYPQRAHCSSVCGCSGDNHPTGVCTKVLADPLAGSLLPAQSSTQGGCAITSGAGKSCSIPVTGAARLASYSFYVSANGYYNISLTNVAFTPVSCIVNNYISITTVVTPYDPLAVIGYVGTPNVNGAAELQITQAGSFNLMIHSSVNIEQRLTLALISNTSISNACTGMTYTWPPTVTTVVLDALCGANTVCSPSQYQSAAANPTTDRSCTSLTTCTGNQYISTPGTPTTNRVCSAVSGACSTGQYKSRNATTTTDRVCANCTAACSSATYISAACTSVSDLVCTPIDLTCPSTSYISLAAVAGISNLACTAYTVCDFTTQYVTTYQTSSSDRVCSPLSGVASGFYVRNATATAPAFMSQWSTCFSYQYQRVLPTKINNAVCQNLTTCTKTQFQSTAPSATNDRVCNTTKICRANQYYTVLPTTSNDAVCHDFTTCPHWQYAAPPPNNVTDITCFTIRNCTWPTIEWAKPTLTTDRFCGGSCGFSTDTAGISAAAVDGSFIYVGATKNGFDASGATLLYTDSGLYMGSAGLVRVNVTDGTIDLNFNRIFDTRLFYTNTSENIAIPGTYISSIQVLQHGVIELTGVFWVPDGGDRTLGAQRPVTRAHTRTSTSTSTTTTLSTSITTPRTPPYFFPRVVLSGLLSSTLSIAVLDRGYSTADEVPNITATTLLPDLDADGVPYNYGIFTAISGNNGHLFFEVLAPGSTVLTAWDNFHFFYQGDVNSIAYYSGTTTQYLYIGGNFVYQNISAVALVVDAHGTIIAQLNTPDNTTVLALTLDVTGNVFLGGDFGLIRYNSLPTPTQVKDDTTTFNLWRQQGDSTSLETVSSLISDGLTVGGYVYAIGNLITRDPFSLIFGGPSRVGIIRVATGALLTDFYFPTKDAAFPSYDSTETPVTGVLLPAQNIIFVFGDFLLQGRSFTPHMAVINTTDGTPVYKDQFYQEIFDIIVSNIGETATTSCKPVRNCNWTSQYQSVAATATTNRICANITQCTSSIISPATRYSNNVCRRGSTVTTPATTMTTTYGATVAPDALPVTASVVGAAKRLINQTPLILVGQGLGSARRAIGGYTYTNADLVALSVYVNAHLNEAVPSLISELEAGTWTSTSPCQYDIDGNLVLNSVDIAIMTHLTLGVDLSPVPQYIVTVDDDIYTLTVFLENPTIDVVVAVIDQAIANPDLIDGSNKHVIGGYTAITMIREDLAGINANINLQQYQISFKPRGDFNVWLQQKVGDIPSYALCGAGSAVPDMTNIDLADYLLGSVQNCFRKAPWLHVTGPDSSSTDYTGVIIGAVCGGVLIVGMILVVLWLQHRHDRMGKYSALASASGTTA